MASGFGLLGKSRCYDTFETFQTCVNDYAIHPSQCVAFREDYHECLHGKKANLRNQELFAAKTRHELKQREGKSWGSL